MMRVLGIALAALLALGPAARAAPPDPDLEGRRLFAAGEYKQALDIYARLYAETMHPTFLRNIGRCHQNLGDPDKAIASFREYLRKAGDLPVEQRAEIDRYITEMEQLQRSRGSSRAFWTGPSQEGTARRLVGADDEGPRIEAKQDQVPRAPYVAYGAAGLAVISLSAAAVTGSLARATPVGSNRAEMQIDLERRQEYATWANGLFIISAVLVATATAVFLRHLRRH